jgi:nitrogen fixation protein FixH
MSTHAEQRPVDRLIPWLFVLGFLVVILVNALMVYVALGSFSGLVTDRPYDRGRAYNTTLEARAKQDALGWTSRFALDSQGDGTQRLLLDVADQAGAPIAGATVDVTLVRPVERGHDRGVALSERGAGRYAGTVALALPGLWEARIVVQRGADRFAAIKRVMVP